MNHPSAIAQTDVSTAAAADIMALFDWYDFTDPHGHPLTLCVPFRQLVERATGETLPPVLAPAAGASGAEGGAGRSYGPGVNSA